MTIERKNPKLSEAGRKGGLAGGKIGGHIRMAQLSGEERSQLAKQAAAARWADPFETHVVDKAKKVLAKIVADGRPMYFYFDGSRAWFSEIDYLEVKNWEQHLVHHCTRDTKLVDIVESALSRG